MMGHSMARVRLGQRLLDLKRGISRARSRGRSTGAPLWAWAVVGFNRIWGRATGGHRVLVAAGRALWLEDDPRSCTLEVLQLEWAAGLYDPPLPIRPGDLVVDVGAHVGGFTIPLALRHPGARFVCYEPDPDNARRLRRNLAYHKVRNATVVEAGIWSTQVRLASAHDAGNTGASRSTPGPGSAWARPLWQVLGAPGGVRLLKLDCEGAEHAVLADARCRESLRRCESLLAEVHVDASKGWDAGPALRALSVVPHRRVAVEPGPHWVDSGSPVAAPAPALAVAEEPGRHEEAEPKERHAAPVRFA